ncbi:MAG: hypothetical protein ABEI76_08455 [Halobacteriales archaeon]
MVDDTDGRPSLLSQLANDRDLLVAVGMAAGLGLFLFGVTKDPLVSVSAFLLAALGAVLLTN